MCFVIIFKLAFVSLASFNYQAFLNQHTIYNQNDKIYN